MLPLDAVRGDIVTGGTHSGELQRAHHHSNPKPSFWLSGPAAAGRHVLAIQDTCEVKFPTTARRRRGLGPVEKGNAYGVLVHAMMAVGAPTGACLGLVGGEVWTREEVIEVDRRDRPLAGRESRRWLAASEQAKSVLRSATMATVVGDRESDIHAQWASVPENGFHVLTRAMNDRRLTGGVPLFETMAGFAKVGQRTIKLHAREPSRAARTAKLEPRFGTVEIVRPHKEWDRSLVRTVPLRAIDVREIGAPPGIEPLHWRLLTMHAIADAAEAWCIVDCYRARWTIEQLFRVLKSHGLQLEDSQVASAERLVKPAAAAAKAACGDIQLTQERDGKAGLSASNVFSAEEIETLAPASWVIARPGGWNCHYKSPGPTTMRHGTIPQHTSRPLPGRGHLIRSDVQ